ncbi:hypothetical protein DRJ54_01190 [Candidatus Acetothermia bacterium]|nr:MAG: hypothetical protein DRJ54_01190 [Candidatus Acetothermia bacterium]
MITALAIVAALALWVSYSGWRASSRLRRGAHQLGSAWEHVQRALSGREQALREFLSTLSSLGLVPRGRQELEKALLEIRKAQTAGPRALAEADDQLKIALRAVYGGLPRSRPPALKQAQNRLAEAEDELDLARHRYNELVLDWNSLLVRWTYRWLAGKLGLSRWEPYLLPGEEEEFARQRGPAF